MADPDIWLWHIGVDLVLGFGGQKILNLGDRSKKVRLSLCISD